MKNVSKQAQLKWLENFARLYPGKTADLQSMAVTLGLKLPTLSLDAFRSWTKKEGLDSGQRQRASGSKHPLQTSTARLGSYAPRPIYSVRIVPFLYGKTCATHALFYVLIKECFSNYLWAEPLTNHVRLYEDKPYVYSFEQKDYDALINIVRKCIAKIGLFPGAIYFPALEKDCANLLVNWAGLATAFKNELDVCDALRVLPEQGMQKVISDISSRNPLLTNFAHSSGTGMDLCCMPSQTWNNGKVDVSKMVSSSSNLTGRIKQFLDCHNFGLCHPTNEGHRAPVMYLGGAWCRVKGIPVPIAKNKELIGYLAGLKHADKVINTKVLADFNLYIHKYVADMSYTQVRRKRPVK